MISSLAPRGRIARTLASALLALLAVVLSPAAVSAGQPSDPDDAEWASQWASAIPVGTSFPGVEAPDQDGQTWTNQELIGVHGLVFFFVRSSDW
jgi:cytochrome oxidase Cu insertion factor (SCO1/SenC/PrrC family)